MQTAASAATGFVFPSRFPLSSPSRPGSATPPAHCHASEPTVRKIQENIPYFLFILLLIPMNKSSGSG